MLAKGDIVKIHPKITQSRYINDFYIPYEMYKFANKYVVIKECKSTYFEICGSRYCFPNSLAIETKSEENILYSYNGNVYIEDDEKRVLIHAEREDMKESHFEDLFNVEEKRFRMDLVSNLF